MIFRSLYFGRHLLTSLLCFTLASSTLYAQPSDVCEDNGCSSAVFSVKLDAPLQGPVTPERTEHFKSAYLQVKQIKDGLRQDLTWEGRYNANALGGRSCVRLNQLESHFAYEYDRNPDFKKFIDQQETDGKAYQENGFESSRRSLNMSRRMETQCPQEARKIKNAGDPSYEEQPAVFMKLGQALGYFDEEGNMLKPMKSLSGIDPEEEEVDFSQLSKRKQVDYLKEQVNQLAAGAQKRDEIAGLTAGLMAARPRQEELDRSLEGLESRFAALLPQPPGLTDKLEMNEGALRDLQSFKPKNPKHDLAPKIDALLDDKKGLAGQTKDLDEEANSLKKRYDRLRKDFDGLQDELDQRVAASEKMLNQLGELEKRRTELAAKLEDKPKKILEELTQQVTDIDQELTDLSKKIEAEQQEKDKVLEKLDGLIQDEAEVAGQLGQLEDKAGQLARDQALLQEEIEKLQWEAEEIRKEEEKVEGLQEQLAGLKSEDALKERIAICEEELKSHQEKIEGLEEARNRYQAETAEHSKIPSEVMDKVAGLKLSLNKLKLGYEDIPVTDRSMAKIDRLLEKASIISSSAEILTGQQERLQQQIDGFGQNLEKAREQYASLAAHLEELREELGALRAENAGLKGKLDQGVEDVEQANALVNDFLERYRAFEEKTKCPEEDVAKALQKEQADIERELKSLGTELNDVARYEENLAQETEALDQEIRENTRLTQELKQEEEAIQEEYGQEVALEAVPVEEWKEAVKVERPYWEASIIPEDELVRGYKGKYFEISLKDAEKKAKVLFSPGRYYMDNKAFRSNYGATLGSFVNEALLYLKKSDEGQVKLFIQGSADISGQNTFRGRLDSDFSYEEITVLPLDEDQEHFLSEPQPLEIPANSFTNDDLPNLRGRYLKEIIGAYTEKFDPIVLQGTVKDFEGVEERNATIYLFFPEDLLDRY